MALSMNKGRKYLPHSSDAYNELAVAASEAIFSGSGIGLSSGYARPLTAGDAFQGFALQQVDGGSTAGAKNVKVIAEGVLTGVSVAGASAVTDIGSAVYLSDDDTLTLTSTSNSLIGKITAFRDGVFDVFFQADSRREAVS